MTDYQLKRQTTMTLQNPATEEIQERLLKLYNGGKIEEFRGQIISMISNHREYFRVLDIHGKDAQQDLSQEEFVKHFSFCFKPELSKALFVVLAEGRSTTSIVNLQLQLQGRRKTSVRQREVVKDAEWLMHKLKNLDLKDIDDDGDLKIQREELREYFKGELDEALVDQIFDAIDRDKNGHITPMEYFQWKGKAKLGSIKTMIREANNVKKQTGGHLEMIVDQEDELDQIDEDNKTSTEQMSEEIEKQQKNEKNEQLEDSTVHDKHPSVAAAAEQQKVAKMKDKNLRTVTFDHEPHPSQYVLNDARVTQKGIDFWENHNKHSSVNEDWWKLQLAEREKLRKKHMHISQQSQHFTGHETWDTIGGISNSGLTVVVDTSEDHNGDEAEPSMIIHGTPSAMNPRQEYIFDVDNEVDKDKEKNTTTFLGYAPTGFQVEYQKLLNDYRLASEMLVQSEQDKETQLTQLKTKQQLIDEHQTRMGELEKQLRGLENQLQRSNLTAEQRLEQLEKLEEQRESMKKEMEKELALKLQNALREEITKQVTESLMKQQEMSNELIKAQWDQQLANLQKQWELSKEAEYQLKLQQHENEVKAAMEQEKAQALEKERREKEALLQEMKRQQKEMEEKAESLKLASQSNVGYHNGDNKNNNNDYNNNNDNNSNNNNNKNKNNNNNDNKHNNENLELLQNELEKAKTTLSQTKLEKDQLEVNLGKNHLNEMSEQQRKYEQELIKLNTLLSQERERLLALENQKTSQELALREQEYQLKIENEKLKQQLNSSNNNNSTYIWSTNNNTTNEFKDIKLEESSVNESSNETDTLLEKSNKPKKQPRTSRVTRVDTDSAQNWCCGLVCCSTTCGISYNDKDKDKDKNQ